MFSELIFIEVKNINIDSEHENDTVEIEIDCARIRLQGSFSHQTRTMMSDVKDRANIP